jgi:hypothetical protein
MKAVVLLALLLAYPDGPAYKGQVREPHALAPSLPVLSEKEEDEIVKIIDRFIEHDIGKLKGEAGKKALGDFKGLGPEATFLLIEGLNRAANMEDSCPAVLIAKRLSLIINGTKDKVLLSYARDLIGAGVTAKRHQVVLKDLRLACSLRKSALERIELAGGNKGGTGGSPPPKEMKEKTLQTMTVAQLAGAAAKEKGELLQKVLVELATRKSDQVFFTLGLVAAKEDKEAAKLARSLLIELLGAAPAAELKSWLKSGTPAVRAAAAQVIGDKGYRFTDELIAALEDADEAVRQAARGALVKLASNLVDHGPVVGALPAERQQAAQRWRMHWQKKQ